MPLTYFGPYGENNSTYATPSGGNAGRWPAGHRLILPDGRVYRFALNDGTVEVAGNLYQSVVALGDHTNIAADVARAVGATAISATLGTTLAGIDIYSEGIVHINDVDGQGYAYRIMRARTSGAGHAAAALSAVLTVNLAAGETVQVALTTNSEMSFTRNRFRAILITAAPPTASLAGVSPGVAAASRWYWSQVAGEAAVLAAGTLLAGLPVQASIATAGAVENVKRRVRTGSTAQADSTVGVLLTDQDGSEVNVRVMTATISTTYDITGGIAYNAPIVGMCLKANASSDYGLVDIQHLGG